jgi:hypothetical protein
LFCFGGKTKRHNGLTTAFNVYRSRDRVIATQCESEEFGKGAAP